MSCLTCGAKETKYTVNGYGLCDECRQSITYDGTPVLLPTFNQWERYCEIKDQEARQEQDAMNRITYEYLQLDTPWNSAAALREFNDDIARDERNRVRLAAAAIVVSAFVFCLIILWAGGVI